MQTSHGMIILCPEMIIPGMPLASDIFTVLHLTRRVQLVTISRPVILKGLQKITIFMKEQSVLNMPSLLIFLCPWKAVILPSKTSYLMTKAASFIVPRW